jgi:lipoprotein-anchoring transpeptidase ErfK/SrfK
MPASQQELSRAAVDYPALRSMRACERMIANRCAFLLIAVLASGAVLPGASAARKRAPAPPPLEAEAVNHAQYSPDPLDRPNPVMLKAQILLDRVAISPGMIDAKDGENTRKAIAAYQQVHGRDATGKLDQETWNELTRGADAPVIVPYEITAQDVKGPFAKRIPHDLKKMARLRHLSYTSPLERLAERFHVAEKVLQRLNPGKRFNKAGTSIAVPDAGTRELAGRVASIEVDKSSKTLRALSENGELIAFFPASIGSKDKPAPSGRYKVRRVAYNPTYHYNPKFRFKGVHTHRKLTIAPGPKNPVGLVWIDLSKESYGIHGTPDPSRIGKTYSHGCIRLTNWDALDLARRVGKGTPVDFVAKPAPLPAREPPGQARARE